MTPKFFMQTQQRVIRQTKQVLAYWIRMRDVAGCLILCFELRAIQSETDREPLQAYFNFQVTSAVQTLRPITVWIGRLNGEFPSFYDAIFDKEIFVFIMRRLRVDTVCFHTCKMLYFPLDEPFFEKYRHMAFFQSLLPLIKQSINTEHRHFQHEKSESGR